MAEKQSFKEQFIRTISLYKVLPKSPEPYLTIDQIELRLNSYYVQHESSRKTLQRDLENLSNILYKGEIEKRSNIGRQAASFRLSADAQLDNQRKNLVQDEFQALITFHSYNFLKHYFPTSWQNSLKEQFDQAIITLEMKKKEAYISKLGFAFDGAFQNYLNSSNEIKELIFQSTYQDSTWLEMTYHPEDVYREPNIYLVKPHGLILRGRKQFLIASKIDQFDQVSLRTFALHRILNVRIVPERLSIDIQNLDMQKAIEQCEYEGFFNQNPEIIELKLRCDASLHHELQFSPIHENQLIYSDEQDDNFFILIASLPISFSLMNWLEQKADFITVVEPHALKIHIQDQIIKKAENYGLEYYDPSEDWDDEVEYDNSIFPDKDRAIQVLKDILDEPEQEYEDGAVQILKDMIRDDDEDNIPLPPKKTKRSTLRSYNPIDFDSTYQKAIELIKNKTFITTFEIKRGLDIDYNSSNKIIDLMQQQGLISENDEEGKRKVLI
ncbi:MAG: WYL domain-containing protein [Acinetobacter sp.]